MFFLDHAWLIPLIPAVSFGVILLFGKRFPRSGSEVGIVAVGASFVLACGAVQWIQHVRIRRRGRRRSAHTGRASSRLGGKTADEKSVGPIVHTTTWFQNGGIKLNAGIQIDGLAVAR